MPRPDLARRAALILLVALVAGGCRSTYYAAWEKLGKEKRDLLRRSVEKARDDQDEAGKQFQDALTRLKALTGFHGGDLEEVFQKVNRDYERCRDRAADVRGRVEEVERVARDLFREWDKELSQIGDERMRAESRRKLAATRERYTALDVAMRRAEKSMEPVLAKLHDQALYLKHNLNAAAIGALTAEVGRIDADVARLVADMQASIAEAEAFLQALP